MSPSSHPGASPPSKLQQIPSNQSDGPTSINDGVVSVRGVRVHVRVPGSFCFPGILGKGKVSESGNYIESGLPLLFLNFFLFFHKVFGVLVFGADFVSVAPAQWFTTGVQPNQPDGLDLLHVRTPHLPHLVHLDIQFADRSSSALFTEDSPPGFMASWLRCLFHLHLRMSVLSLFSCYFRLLPFTASRSVRLDLSKSQRLRWCRQVKS